MTTPTTQSHPTEPEATREGGPAGATSSPDESATTPGTGKRNPGAIDDRRLNIAMFSIGAVAMTGMLAILFGLYITKPENVAVIFIGTIILLIAVLAWGVVVLVMIGHLIRGIVNSRGKKGHKPPLSSE